MKKEPKTIEEARRLEIEAVARLQAKELTRDLRERGILGPKEEVVWEWESEGAAPK